MDQRIIREAMAGKIFEWVKTTASSFAITWIQAEAGFGKTFIARYLVKEAAQNFSYKTAEIHFYPQPDTAINKFQYEVLKAILPSNEAEWINIVKSNEFFHSLGDSAFVLSCLSDILHPESSSLTSYSHLDKASKVKVRKRIVCELIKGFLQKNKLLLFLEDLHWLNKDEATEINAILSECKNNSGFHVVCTSRKAFILEDSLQLYAETFKLPPLTQEQSLAFLRESGFFLSDEISLKISNLSTGNPFFVKEYAEWTQGESKKGQALEGVFERINQYTPQEISRVIYSKLGNCDEVTIGIAKAASIQGIRIDVEALFAVMGLSKEKITENIDVLLSEKILKLNKNSLNEEYEFSHELIQRVIYDSIPVKIKTSLHEKLVQHLRFSKRAHYECVARLMSYHANQADNMVLAYICAKKAARETNRLSQHKAAREYLENAKDALDRIKGSFKKERHIMRLRMEEMDSLFIMGDYEAVKTSLDYLLKKKSSLSLNMLKQVLSFQGLFFWVNGKIPKAKKVYESILTADPKAFSEETLLREGMRLANICIDLSQYAESVKHSENVISFLNKDNAHLKCGLLGEVGPAIYSCLALAQAKLGNNAEAFIAVEKAQQLVSESEDYFTRIYTSVFLAHALLTLEKYEDVKSLLKTTLIYCNTVQSDLLKPYALSAYGLASAKLGDIRAGERFCTEAIEVARKSNLLLRRSLFNIWYAEVLMLGKKHSEAMKYLNFAIDGAAASGEISRLQKAFALLTQCQNIVSVKRKKQQKKRPHTLFQKRRKSIQEAFIVENGRSLSDQKSNRAGKR